MMDFISDTPLREGNGLQVWPMRSLRTTSIFKVLNTCGIRGRRLYIE